MKTSLIIPLLIAAGVAVYIYEAKSNEDENLRDDPAFRKGFAAGFVTPSWSILLLAGGVFYIYK